MTLSGLPSRRWQQRPPHANWGDFGPDDEIGRLNLITPERRIAAVAEVKEGRVFCLSLPLDIPGGNLLVPERHPPSRGVVPRTCNHHFVNFPLSCEDPSWTDVVCDDYVKLYTQYSTQWDALSHLGQYFDADGDGVDEMVYYNGFRAGEHIIGVEGTVGAHRLGIEKMAETCVQGRGVLVDLHAHFGSERRLVGFEDMKAVMEADGVTVESGDMLCLHTGWSQAVLAMNGHPDEKTLHDGHPVLDGRDDRLLQWINESGISVLIADNFAVEGFPYNDRRGGARKPGLPLHRRCLFELGIHLGELWYLSPLAAHLRVRGRSRFLLTAPPLRLPGSFGSPLTPVATV